LDVSRANTWDRSATTIAETRGEIHSKIGGRESQPARENYQKCLDILQDLDAKKLLSEVDLKFLERTRAALKPVG